ncbi:MAG: peroxiredoxin [Alphaproteobacteria bacterium]|nr:MAG: peroxiredoxin [Alphaproteobacteria bacterium]
MTISVGDKIPEATLMQMTGDGPAPVSSSDLFGGKKVVLFAVPGAFTPTCSAQHLPSYIDNADALVAKGADSIVCMSVNDVFVMDAWGKDRGVGDKVQMIADGNGDFTTALGLGMDGSGFGLGQRSQRFSLIAEDGVVTHLNLEQGGEFKNSAAEVALKQL